MGKINHKNRNYARIHDYNIEIVKILWHNNRTINIRQRIL